MPLFGGSKAALGLRSGHEHAFVRFLHHGKQDLTTAARLNPKMYHTYVMLDRTTGQVMIMPSKSKGRLTLEQITGIYIDTPAQPPEVAHLSLPAPRPAKKVVESPQAVLF